MVTKLCVFSPIVQFKYQIKIQNHWTMETRSIFHFNAISYSSLIFYSENYNTKEMERRKRNQLKRLKWYNHTYKLLPMPVYDIDIIFGGDAQNFFLLPNQKTPLSPVIIWEPWMVYNGKLNYNLSQVNYWFRICCIDIGHYYNDVRSRSLFDEYLIWIMDCISTNYIYFSQ